MLAGTPTITAEELAKRLADPETYPCCSAALQGKHRDVETCLCSFCRSPEGSATESCDDTPKWRKTVAAPGEEEEAEEEEADITKKIMFSPAKTIFNHKVESGVTAHATWSKRQRASRPTFA